MILPAGIQHPETSIQHRCAGVICIERSNNTTNGSNGTAPLVGLRRSFTRLREEDES
jgi:hypothetical protein